jgi:ferritin-like metal-binding protein YciE
LATELNARDLKLVQYLNEAYGKEKQLETALTADIAMTTDKGYRKRLQDHLKETREHARRVKSRIRALGGRPEEVSVPGPDAVSDVATGAVNLANRAVAAAKGPAHMLRGTGEQEKLLKNAKTQYWNEFEEIATYAALETLADTVGDKETAKVAREIRRQEERMAKFLEGLIPRLTKGVAREEIPAALRNGGRKRRSSSRKRTAAKSSSRSSSSSRSRSTKGRKRSTAKSRTTKGRAGSTSRSAKSRARSTARTTKKRARSAAKTARSTAKTARTSARAAGTAAKRSRAGAKGGRKRTKSRSR